MLTKADLKLADEYLNSTYIQITKGATDTVVGSNPTNYYNALKAAGIPCSYYETMGGDLQAKETVVTGQLYTSTVCIIS